jgi:hypothetical protein
MRATEVQNAGQESNETRQNTAEYDDKKVTNFLTGWCNFTLVGFVLKRRRVFVVLLPGVQEWEFKLCSLIRSLEKYVRFYSWPP